MSEAWSGGILVLDGVSLEALIWKIVGVINGWIELGGSGKVWGGRLA